MSCGEIEGVNRPYRKEPDKVAALVERVKRYDPTAGSRRHNTSEDRGEEK
jgi:hypothetical protein